MPNTGQILEALNDKTDRDMHNVDTGVGADAVIAYQEPDSTNEYKWYRKYASGWVEQGGITVVNSSSVSGNTYSTKDVVFLIPMSYVCNWNTQAKHDRFNTGFATDLMGQAADGGTLYQVNDSSSTAFSNPYVVWEVKGMAVRS